MAGSKKHLKLKRQFEEILAQYSDRFSPDSPESELSIFIGATASILEALERGVNVIHICSDPLFESHNEAIWSYLKIEQIGTYTFRYRLRSLGRYIKLGSEQDMISKYCSS
jgi:hypothetical protein